MTIKTNSLQARFDAKWMPEPNSGCWIWIGATTGKWCRANFFNGKRVEAAPRVSWRLRHGPFPAELCVCHKCDTPACVNPDHLFLGTHRDNVKDCESKGRGRHLTGSAHPRAKLTEEEVREIRTSSAPAIFFQRKFRIGQAAISKIRLRQSWRKLPDHETESRSYPQKPQPHDE